MTHSWGQLGRKYDFDELPFGKFKKIAQAYYPDWGEPIRTDEEGIPLLKYRVAYAYIVKRKDSEVFEAVSPEQARKMAEEEYGGLAEFQVMDVKAI